MKCLKINHETVLAKIELYLNKKLLELLLASALFCICGFAAQADEQKQVSIKVSEKGLESLKYDGVEYCEPSDCGVLGFNKRPGTEGDKVSPPCVLDTKKSKEPFSQEPLSSAVTDSTVTKTYPWGTLVATYVVKGADLYVIATITNSSKIPIGWWKANLLQLNSRLVFDNKPWNAAIPYGYTPDMHWDYRYAMWGVECDQYATWNFSDPHVYWWVDRAAPFDKAPVRIMFADLDPKWQTGVYHVKTDKGDAWPVVGSADGDPGETVRLAPGQSDTVHIAIRFRTKLPDDVSVVEKNRAKLQVVEEKVKAAQARLKSEEEEVESGLMEASAADASKKVLAALQTDLEKTRVEYATVGVGALPSALEVCADGYEAFGRAFPRTVRWTDRRPIGTYFSCRGERASATNPNKWFNDTKIDTITPEGREAFATRLLAEIDATIATLNEVGGQGVIWWDVEGARNPHPITYIGDPRVLDPAHPQHDKYAPELDTQVKYKGQQMKLVDACFKKWQDAGLKTGVTIRPQTLDWKDDSPHQISTDDPGSLLCEKATYARERWGCTIFYVDSVSDFFGSWMLEKTVGKYPDILMMPEWGRTRSYRHGSSFSYTKFTGFMRGVPAEMQACWPDAFCCMGNFDYEKNYEDALYAVKHGNVQVFNCWYNGPEAKKIKQIYQTTGVKHIPQAEDQKVTVAPETSAQITFKTTDEDGDSVTFSILGYPAHGTLDKFDSKKGTATYTPDNGYTGEDVFTFKATDSTGLNSNRGTVTITVK